MIKTFDYLRTLPDIEESVMAAVQRVLRSGILLLGPETNAFEKEFSQYVEAPHCVAVSSGTEALHLALKALEVGPGDEVITVSNTCTPTVSAIRLAGATPVFVDVRDEDLMLDHDALPSLITNRTRCILPVHLWGYSVQIDRVLQVAQDFGIPVVEDCAQAHGTRFTKKHVGNFGDMGCFSFYPTKNLGAFGDAGAVVTGDEELARRVRALRMYGYDSAGVSQIEGTNARISEIQAAILRVKLRLLERHINQRRSLASAYDGLLKNDSVQLPPRSEVIEPSFHQYVVRCGNRSAVIDRLKRENVGHSIHYPVPVHWMPAYRSVARAPASLKVTERAAGEILSLPIHEGLHRNEVELVAEAVNAAD